MISVFLCAKIMVQIIKSDIHAVLRFIAPYLPSDPIIIEAGAFQGHGTVVMAQKWPHAVIYAFEPVPEIFNKLIEKTKDIERINCYQLALSDASGSAVFYVAEKPEKPGRPTQAGSLLVPTQRLSWSPMIYNHNIEIEMITLDDWAKKQQVNQVDFLWLDVQGNELAALKGGISLIKTVTVIYVEVHFIEAYEKQPIFEEVTCWLHDQGFTLLAQDFTDRTSWFFGNAVFVRRNKNQF